MRIASHSGPVLGPVLGALLLTCGTAPPSPAPEPSPPPRPPAVASTAAATTAPIPIPAPVAAETVAPSSTAAPAAPRPEAPLRACPEDMVDVSVACIDRYEAPNRRGDKPLLMQTAPEAEAWCTERGKRLCTEDEWLRACQGPEAWPYPYGPRYQEHACNQDKRFIPPHWKVLHRWPSEAGKAEAARLDQAEPSGARESCRSAEGVYDLTGNAAEWVVKTRSHPEACLTPEQESHPHVVQGCYWGKCYREPHEPRCGYVNCSHPGRFRSYEFGFRCCQDRRVR